VPYRRSDAEFLRDKARSFRRMATQLDAAVAKGLLQMANDMEAKADEIERRPDPRLSN
jgi:hypothetical protein